MDVKSANGDYTDFAILKRKTIQAAKDLCYETICPGIIEKLKDCDSEEKLSLIMTTARKAMKD